MALPDEDRPRVDVVILAWNDGDLLDAAVASVLALEPGIDVSCLVVDNASEPPAEVVDDPRVRVHRNATNRGVAGGRNDGAALGDAPFLCFLDSDAAFTPAALGLLLQPLLEDPSIAVTVPVFADQPPEAGAGRRPTLGRKLQRLRGRTDRYEPSPGTGVGDRWDVDFGIGACQLIRRAAFDGVGGLDETMYWTEDVDFCLRVGAAGGRVVQVGAATVHHPPRRRYRTPLSRRGLRHGWALTRFLWRHRGR